MKGTPILATIHDVYSSGWIQRGGFRKYLMVLFERITLKLPYTKVITVSDASKEKLVASGVPREKIEVIPNGVDVRKYDEVKVKKSDIPRVIYIGRLIGYKRVDDLLLAFSRLDLDAELYIVGEGPERKNLEALARKLGVDNKVTFTGFVSELRKIELLKSSHVLVLPSTTEGFGIALVEAMAAKTPVIAADIPALRELVGDEEVGLLFRPRDVDALKMKLERLLKEGELRKQLSHEGYEFVKRKLDWDKVTKEVESLLKACRGGA
jgi:glycosyltransferase involved in cell wall biosynthesis